MASCHLVSVELSPGDTEEPTTTAFIGIIDELRIWHRAFDPILIQQNLKMNVQPTHPTLAGLWKLNEGEGDTIHDLVGEEHLYLPRSPWQRPTWVYSDVDVKTNFSLTSTPYFDSNRTMEETAKGLCWEIFFKSQLHSACESLKAELEFHLLLCIQDIGSTGDMSAAISSVITFADHCEAVLSLYFWPAQKLCNMIPGAIFPNWIGDNCDVRCVFGKAKKNDRNVCECNHGYWGANCLSICPGGILSTCANHGICTRETGKCVCNINWQGTENCTSCSTGWYGSRCQFAVGVVDRVSSSLEIAAVGSFGYYRSFAGLCFTYRVHGEFYLVRSPVDGFVIQIRRGYCGGGNSLSTTCTVAFAFSYKDVRIAIRAPITTVARTSILFPIVWLNGRLPSN